MLRWAVASSVALAALSAAHAAASGCAHDQAYHLLDFWLGDWDVYVAGVFDGHNHIIGILDGCAVQENWSDVSGYEGKSWFYLEPATHRLKQVWLTSLASRPGGTKEKAQVAAPDELSVRFQGSVQDADHRPLLDRTTLTPIADGSVRQLIETSRDGRRWAVAYDAIYRRRAAGS